MGLFDAVTDETENGSGPEEEGEEASKLRGGGRGCNDGASEASREIGCVSVWGGLLRARLNSASHLPQELHPLRSLLRGCEDVVTELQILLFNAGSIEAGCRVGLETGKEDIQV